MYLKYHIMVHHSWRLLVKKMPEMQETQVRSLGWEDPLEKEMATRLEYSCLGNPMENGSWQATDTTKAT